MVMSRLMHVTRICDAHACVHACVQGTSCCFRYREARHRSAAGSLTHSPLTQTRVQVAAQMETVV